MVVAILNSMLFAVANGSPMIITRSGLFANSISAVAIWLVLLIGHRNGWEQLAVFLVVFSIIHYLLVCNILAVINYGL